MFQTKLYNSDKPTANCRASPLDLHVVYIDSALLTVAIGDFWQVH